MGGLKYYSYPPLPIWWWVWGRYAVFSAFQFTDEGPRQHQEPDHARPALGSRADDAVNSKLSLVKHSVIVTNLPLGVSRGTTLFLLYASCRTIYRHYSVGIAIFKGKAGLCGHTGGWPSRPMCILIQQRAFPPRNQTTDLPRRQRRRQGRECV